MLPRGWPTRELIASDHEAHGMSLPVQEGQQQHQEGPTLQPFHNDFLRIYEDCRAARQNQYWSSLNGNLSGLPSFPAVGPSQRRATLSPEGAEGPVDALEQQQQSHPVHSVPHPVEQQQQNIASRPQQQQQQQHIEPAAQRGAALGQGKPLPAAPAPAACVQPAAAVVGREVAQELIGSMPAPVEAVQFTLEELAGSLSAGPLPSSFRLALERFLPPQQQQQQQHQGDMPAAAASPPRLQHGLEELLQTVVGLVNQALTKAVAEKKPGAALRTFNMEMYDITLHCCTKLLPVFTDCLRAADVPESDPAFRARRVLFGAVVRCLRTMVGVSLDDAISGGSSRTGSVHAA